MAIATAISIRSDGSRWDFPENLSSKTRLFTDDRYLGNTIRSINSAIVYLLKMSTMRDDILGSFGAFAEMKSTGQQESFAFCTR